MRVPIHHDNYIHCSHTSSHAFIWLVPSVFAFPFHNSVPYVNMFHTLAATINEGPNPSSGFFLCRQVTACCTVCVLKFSYRCGFSSGVIPLTALLFLPQQQVACLETTPVNRIPGWRYQFNPSNTKRRPLYLKPQSVPRSKHFSYRL